MVAFTPINTDRPEQPYADNSSSTLIKSTNVCDRVASYPSVASRGLNTREKCGTAVMNVDTQVRKRQRLGNGDGKVRNAKNLEGNAGHDVIMIESTSLEMRSNNNNALSICMKSRDNQEDVRSPPPFEPLSVTATTFSTPTSIDALRASGGTCVTLYQSAEVRATDPNASMPWTRSNAGRDSTSLSSNTQEQSEACYAPSYQKHDVSDTVQISDHTILEVAADTHEPARSDIQIHAVYEGDLSCEIDDAAEETTGHTVQCFPSQGSAPRDRRMNIREVDEHDDYGGALLSTLERELLRKRQLQSEMPNRPVARKPFPVPVPAHSLIFGVSNSTVLRTCFRLGEALNAGCNATRHNENVILEIYARVVASWRDGPPWQKQHFVLRDLYHDNPPHLLGFYGHWSQSPLWAADSEVFLNAEGAGVKARIIGMIKREGLSWRLQILNIWEASWEDVDTVADIYCT